MLSPADLNRQPSITAGVLVLAIVMAIFSAGVLVDRPTIGYLVSLWDRVSGRLFDVARLSVSIPPCPDPGGSWWFHGTLLCTTPSGGPDR